MSTTLSLTLQPKYIHHPVHINAEYAYFVILCSVNSRYSCLRNIIVHQISYYFNQLMSYGGFLIYRQIRHPLLSATIKYVDNVDDNNCIIIFRNPRCSVKTV